MKLHVSWLTLVVVFTLLLLCRYPHWGTALSEHCFTFSVGYRSPSTVDMIHTFAQELVKSNKMRKEALRFTDAKASYINKYRTAAERMKLDKEAIALARQQLRQVVDEALGDDEFVVEWFSSLVTQPMRDLANQERDSQQQTSMEGFMFGEEDVPEELRAELDEMLALEDENEEHDVPTNFLSSASTPSSSDGEELHLMQGLADVEDFREEMVLVEQLLYDYDASIAMSLRHSIGMLKCCDLINTRFPVNLLYKLCSFTQ